MGEALVHWFCGVTFAIGAISFWVGRGSLKQAEASFREASEFYEKVNEGRLEDVKAKIIEEARTT